MTKVKMTEKGTILLPKEVRDRRGFAAGTEFEVIDGGRDTVLKPVEGADEGELSPEKKISVEEFIAGIPRYTGPPITDEMINEAISEEAGRRWDRVKRQWDDDKNN